MVAPILDKIAKEQEGNLVVAKVDTDKNSQWAMKFQVQGIPTMLFILNGEVVHEQVGALPEKIIREIVTKFLEVAKAPAKA